MECEKFPILTNQDVLPLLSLVDIIQILRDMFVCLSKEQAVQPEQNRVLLPNNHGDFINYFGAMEDGSVLGVKVSPCICKKNGTIITAWTLLMSAETGQPLMLCDASILTVERTAATTALAVDELAKANAETVTVIGTGEIGQAHIRHIAHLRQWKEIRVSSGSLPVKDSCYREKLSIIDKRIILCTTVAEAVDGADVILLCTSSIVPVLDPRSLSKTCLITSISTSAPSAHEVPPESLSEMDVYCDYRPTTPKIAGEMKIASDLYKWNAGQIKGDLPGLVTRQSLMPDYKKPVFFRSVGLGLEDIALAWEIRKLHLKNKGSVLCKSEHLALSNG